MSTPPRRDNMHSLSPDRTEKPLELRPLVRLSNIDTSRYVVGQCSERDVQIYKLIFQQINTKGDGMITPLEIRKALSNYGGYKANRKQIYKVMACWDIDLSGEISIDQFITMMTLKLNQKKDTLDDIEKVFNQIDREGKGYISYQDLYDLAEELGEEISEEEVAEIMRKCDPSREGKITKQAFIAFNKQNSF